MIVLQVLLWLALIGLVIAGIVTAIIGARLRQPLLGLIGVLPLAVAVLFLVFGGQPQPPAPGFWSVAALGFAVLAVVGGSPLTVLVLNHAAPGAASELGEHGGILVAEKGADKGTTKAAATREVLRGGSTIGYLERFAIVGSIAIGHPEVIAALIAIKGLGRFSELDSAAARERFIIGTLVSMIWAGTCGALILLSVPGFITWQVG